MKRERREGMAILIECGYCHTKQSRRNKRCIGKRKKEDCRADLDAARKAKKVRYWILFRVQGKQRKEAVGSFEGLNPYSLKDAEKALAKRVVQRTEKRLFDMLPGVDMSFAELAEWYLGLNSVKKLATYETVKWAIGRFNQTFGNKVVGTLRPVDLEDFQDQLEAEDAAPATIDMVLIRAGTMVRKGWDNDLVSDRPVKAFRKVKNRLVAGSNARGRTLTLDEYQRLVEAAADHLRPIIITGYFTGMRQGELLQLKRSHIGRDYQMIRFPLGLTKEGKMKGIPEDSPLRKNIPINHHVKAALKTIFLSKVVHADFVFTYQGKPIGAKIRNAFKGACQRAGIPYGTKLENGVRFHDIRTTVKTNMLRAGIDKVLRDTILGHSLKGMDAYYLKPSDEDLQEAMDKFTEWFDTQLSSVAYLVAQEAKSG
jgi:integrase